MKTTLDCVARITLFSTFLYVLNEGQFSSTKTVIAYYSTFLVLLVFNAIFNKREKQWTRRNMIGNPLKLLNVNKTDIYLDLMLHLRR